MPKQTLITRLFPFKGWYKDQNSSSAPANYLLECQNALIEPGRVTERPQFLPNEYVTSGAIIHLLSTQGYMYADIGTGVYQQAKAGSVFGSLFTWSGTPNYMSVVAINNMAYFFADLNIAPYQWDMSGAAVSYASGNPTENCGECILHKGGLVACQSYTNTNYVHFGIPDTATFNATNILTIPSEVSGYSALRLFSLGDELMVLTDLCVYIVTGAVPELKQYPLFQTPGMYTTAKKCSVKGTKGIYYLTTDLRMVRFLGASTDDISTPFFGTYIKDDVYVLGLPSAGMYSDGRYIYFSYISKEIDSTSTPPNRTLVFDEITDQWVGDYRINLTGVIKDANAIPDQYARAALYGTNLCRFPIKKTSTAEANWALKGRQSSSVAGGILTIAPGANNGTNCLYNRIDRETWSNTTGWTVEIKAKCTGASASAITLDIYDGSYVVNLTFSKTALAITSPAKTVVQDFTSAYVTVRVTGKVSGGVTKIRIYLNGAVVDWGGSVYDLALDSVNTSDGVEFGYTAQSGVTNILDIDYVKYCITGQYAAGTTPTWSVEYSGSTLPNLCMGGEQITSLVQTNDVDPGTGQIRDYSKLYLELDVESLGSMLAYIRTNKGSWSSAKTISLVSPGIPYGDEGTQDTETRYLVQFPWLLDPRESTGRRIGVKLSHSGTYSGFSLNEMYAESLISMVDKVKEL